MVLLEGQKGYFLQDFSVENSVFSRLHAVFRTMRLSEEKLGMARRKRLSFFVSFLSGAAYNQGVIESAKGKESMPEISPFYGIRITMFYSTITRSFPCGIRWQQRLNRHPSWLCHPGRTVISPVKAHSRLVRAAPGRVDAKLGAGQRCQTP